MIFNLSIINAVPIVRSADTDAQLDNNFLPDKTHVDGVPRGELPDEFVDIATRMDKMRLRAIVFNDNTERVLEDILKKLFGKGAGLDDEVNGTKKDKQLNQHDVDLATVGDAVIDDKENKRVKRQDVDIATLCPDMSCIGLLKQYEQWRKEHGYAYYTGVWKVGK